MNERSDHQHDDGDQRTSRIQQLTGEFMRRCFAGSPPSVPELLCEHPDLLPELEQELRRAQLIVGAGAESPESLVETGDAESTHAVSRLLAEIQQAASTDRLAETTGPGRTIATVHLNDTCPEFDRFQVIRKLGQGGFGTVYLAVDTRLHRQVAIKLPHHVTGGSEAVAVQNELEEARKIARLDHPAIVPVYDVGTTPTGANYTITKFIEGEDLATRMQRARMSPLAAARLAARVAEGLQHAHERGIVHRDVKPANILLDAEERPYVVDFGLALQTQDGRHFGQHAGTPSYMSPEQARGEGHRVDGRSDVFSLGVVLYELLTGQRPFQADSATELRRLVQRVEFVRPRQLVASVPGELERVCGKAMAKLASQRYQSAAELAQDLHFFVRDCEQQSAAAHPSEEPRQVASKGLRSFDESDAESYLELLPGPRGRDGLPESIRSWLERLNDVHPDRLLKVGVIYGPSGSGKSSFVRAGILPRLSRDVSTIYVAATRDGTEASLSRQLRSRWPLLSPDAALADRCADLRRGQGRATGTRVMIVIDQFEQWLHAQRPWEGLVDALRQCDGASLQCLLIVRDDFWMGITRFMQRLEVPIVDGVNSMALSRFSPRHARTVLEQFGRANGALPAADEPLRSAQARFLDAAVDELAMSENLVASQLSLLVEAMAEHPWSLASLRRFGGLQGLGAAHLENLFGDAAPDIGNRVHGAAIRRMLRALLPNDGEVMRGDPVPRSQLLEASGYEDRPTDFDRVLQILDEETHIITPVDQSHDDGLPVAAESTYQLTHDSLVPSLRDWLAFKQRETRRGRAELLLADRAAHWCGAPSIQRLPTFSETCRILLLTTGRRRRPIEQQMLAAAKSYYLRRALVVSAVGLVLVASAVWANQRNRATQVVEQVMVADPSLAPQIAAQVASFDDALDQRLHEIACRDDDSDAKLNAAICILERFPEHVAFVVDRWLAAPDYQFFALRAQLAADAGVRGELLQRMNVVKPSRRFRAAAALMDAQVKSPPTAELMGTQLVRAVRNQPLHFDDWVSLLRPWSDQLKPVLFSIHRGDSSMMDYRDRQMATLLSTRFFADDPRHLLSLIETADEVQFHEVFPAFDASWSCCEPSVRNGIEQESLATTNSPAEAERVAKRAIALWRVDAPSLFDQIVTRSPHPTRTNEILQRVREFQIDPRGLMSRIEQDPPADRLQPLLLAVAEFSHDDFSAEFREQDVAAVEQLYRHHPDAGVHGSAAWVLKKWGRPQIMTEAATQLASDAPPTDREWWIRADGTTFLLVRGPVEFEMGTRTADREKIGGRHENSHRRRIERSFAFAAHETTIEEFTRFLQHDPLINLRHAPNGQSVDEMSLKCPQLFVSWYVAAQYCNWLSEEEGIPESEWCYLPNGDGLYEAGMVVPDDYLERTGYRLPTEAEWEYVCRAGVMDPRWVGRSGDGLDASAWYDANSDLQPQPVGQLRPNPWGVYDILGNAFEWCNDRSSRYPNRDTAVLIDASSNAAGEVNEDHWRIVRGGSFASSFEMSRAAFRYIAKPAEGNTFGIRVVRTLRTDPN